MDNMNNMNTSNGVFSGQQMNARPPQEPMQFYQPPQQNMPPADNMSKQAGPIKKFFAGIVVSLLILAAAIGIQFVVMIIMIVIKAMEYTVELNGDLDYVMQALDRMMSDPEFLTTLTVIATLVSAVFAVFFYWLICGRKKTQEDKAYFRDKILTGRNAFMITIACVGLYYLALLIASAIEVISPQTVEDYSEMMDLALGGNVLLALLTTVLIAPISEECFVRGLILRNLQKYFSNTTAIIIQAILFGLFHMNWVQGIYVLPVGAAFGFIAVKSRSVFPTIYAHMFYNFMSVIVALLPAFCETIAFGVIAVVSCAVTVWLMYRDTWINK